MSILALSLVIVGPTRCTLALECEPSARQLVEELARSDLWAERMPWRVSKPRKSRVFSSVSGWQQGGCSGRERLRQFFNGLLKDLRVG